MIVWFNDHASSLENTVSLQFCPNYKDRNDVIDKEERIVRDKTNEEFQEMVSSFEINQTCPLYGTKVPFAGGEVGKMEEAILDSYGLTKADFEVPKMPRLGSHGLRRAMRFQVW